MEGTNEAMLELLSTLDIEELEMAPHDISLVAIRYWVEDYARVEMLIKLRLHNEATDSSESLERARVCIYGKVTLVATLIDLLSNGAHDPYDAKNMVGMIMRDKDITDTRSLTPEFFELR